MQTFRFPGLVAQQSAHHQVLSIRARVGQLRQIADIPRVVRDANGALSGFQRHLINKHVQEIAAYLSQPEAILPNALVLAFVDNAQVKLLEEGFCELTVTVDDEGEAPACVVDGQQRLSALMASGRNDFEVLVSVLVCQDMAELRRQFVLINNTRPLPKSLVYELLPSVQGLPQRFSARTLASRLVELLNFREDSALRKLIQQHTNGDGIVRDTVIQKLVMNSWSNGALRDFANEPDVDERCYTLVNNFFSAVRTVWPEAFELDYKTKSRRLRVSRLLHGTSIVALGFVMDLLVGRADAVTKDEFVRYLTLLKPECRWAHGNWHFSDGSVLPHDALQYTSQDISRLGAHLCQVMRKSMRSAVKASAQPANNLPLAA